MILHVNEGNIFYLKSLLAESKTFLFKKLVAGDHIDLGCLASLIAFLLMGKTHTLFKLVFGIMKMFVLLYMIHVTISCN